MSRLYGFHAIASFPLHPRMPTLSIAVYICEVSEINIIPSSHTTHLVKLAEMKQERQHGAPETDWLGQFVNPRYAHMSQQLSQF
eukprot:1828322-Amphidinium_carterae.1